MRRPTRRTARRVARRTARRTTRRVIRRRRRRRVVLGGMILLSAGAGAAAVKLTQRDAQRIEEHSGASVDELTDEELTGAMKDLGIQSAALSPEEKAALEAAPPPEGEISSAEGGPPSGSESSVQDESYLDELAALADLRDRGIITEEEFQAKKEQILGL